MYGAFIAPLSVAVLMLATNDSFAQVAHAAPRAGIASTHSMPRPPAVGHFRRNHPRAFLPATVGFPYGSSYGEPMAPDVNNANQSMTGDIRYTYTQDVPWDWPHRFPPLVAPSDRPYVQSCAAESVTVPGRNGKEQTVNITRCF